MSKKIYGGLSIQNSQEIGFFDADSSNFFALKAPASLTGNSTLTLPDGDSTGTQALISDGAGAMSWSSFLNTTLTDGTVYVGNVSNVATAVTLSGDISISNAGVAAIGSLVIVDADVNASAAIALSKLAATTVSRALVSDASGFIVPSLVTDVEIGHLDGVTSAIQTQFTGKAGTALDNLSVASLAAEDILVASSGTAVGRLAKGTNGQVLKIVAGVVAWAADAGSNSFTADWITADTATKAIVHSLGSKDIIVQVYDKTDDSTIELDSVIRTDANTLTLSSSVAPGASGWRVLILAI